MPRSNARRRIARLSASGRSSPKFCHRPSEIAGSWMPLRADAAVGHLVVARGVGEVGWLGARGVEWHRAIIALVSARCSSLAPREDASQVEGREHPDGSLAVGILHDQMSAAALTHRLGGDGEWLAA